MNTAETVKLLEAGTGYEEPRALTPMTLIEMAVSRGASIEELGKLLDLQQRWEADVARKAFVKAMNSFKSDLPEITKNRHVKFQTSKGITQYDHATLDNVCDVLIPALSKYGLHHRWRVAQDNGKISVTCVITHELGHSEETTMEASADDSGGKNPIQAISSSTSYLERYTFLAATGTAAKGTDTDGVAFTPQLEQELRAIREAPDLSALKMVSTQPIQDYMKAGTMQALQAAKILIDARDEAKKKLFAEEPA